MSFFKKMRKHDQLEAERWFQELDHETQQETAIKYLRSLDNKSLKNLIAAVEMYREGDALIANKVKDPEPVEDKED